MINAVKIKTHSLSVKKEKPITSFWVDKEGGPGERSVPFIQKDTGQGGTGEGMGETPAPGICKKEFNL